MTPRTDPHRPGAIIPTDYTCVANFGVYKILGDEQEDHEEYGMDEARALEASGRFANIHPGLFSCDVCGARYNHGDVLLHIPTGQYITIGHDCADKYQMIISRDGWVAWHKSVQERRSLAAQEKRFATARDKFIEETPGLAGAFVLIPPHGEPRSKEQAILGDMFSKLHRYGTLSEKQVAFALRLAEGIRNPKPIVEEAHVPAPTGRVRFTGVVVSAKVVEGDYGDTYKMVVKVETPNGSWLTWVTMPVGMLEALGRYCDTLDYSTSSLYEAKGKTVELTATLSPGKDPYFCFGKRPTFHTLHGLQVADRPEATR